MFRMAFSALLRCFSATSARLLQVTRASWTQSEDGLQEHTSFLRCLPTLGAHQAAGAGRGGTAWVLPGRGWGQKAGKVMGSPRPLVF